MQRSVLVLAGVVCALGLFIGLVYADEIVLKGEHPELGGVKGRIVSGAKPGKKPGEWIRTGDEVEIVISVNNDVVGTMWFSWDRIQSINFTGQNKSSYTVNKETREEQERQGEREAAAYAIWMKEQKEKSKAEAEKEGAEPGKKEGEPETGFMPDEEKQIDIWIAQLGLGSQRHAGRRRHAKAKLVEKGKKVVPKVADALNTTNKLLKRNAAAVLGSIGIDAEAAVGSLVNAAKDDDKFVRFEVIEALRKITGEDFGYKWESSVIEQRSAVKKWNKWWKAEQEKKEKESSDEESSSAPTPSGTGEPEPTTTKPIGR